LGEILSAQARQRQAYIPRRGVGPPADFRAAAQSQPELRSAGAAGDGHAFILQIVKFSTNAKLTHAK